MIAIDSYALMTAAPLAENANSWWGSPLISGGFLIAGALISLGSSWFLDRQRAKRESPRRWDDNIREYAADFLVQIDKYIDGLRDIDRPVPKPDDLDRPPEGVTREHNYQRMQAIMDAPGIEQSLWRTMNQLDFIAPASVTKVGRALQEEVSWARTMGLIYDPEIRQKIEAARVDFVNEVRKAIELAPVESPTKKSPRSSLSR